MDLKKFLKGNVLVVASVGDMDACASFVAFRELVRKLNPKVRLEFTFSGMINKDGARIMKLYNFQTKLIEDIPLEDFENLILIDTQLNNIPDYLKNKKTIIIDHHQKAAEIPAGSAFDSEAASTTEVIYGLFKKYKIKFAENIAKAIFSSYQSQNCAGNRLNHTARSSFADQQNLSGVILEAKEIFPTKNFNP